MIFKLESMDFNAFSVSSSGFDPVAGLLVGIIRILNGGGMHGGGTDPMHVKARASLAKIVGFVFMV